MSRPEVYRRKSRKRRIVILVIIIIELICLTFMSMKVYSLSEEQTRENLQKAVTSQVLSIIPTFSVESDIEKAIAAYEEDIRWKGPVLSKSKGTITGPSGKETYYNLNMSGVVKIMRRMGIDDEYWIREDGVKMLGDYVMVAANLDLRPRGSLVETSLGTAIVCDTGGFARRNPTQVDVAVTW